MADDLSADATPRWRISKACQECRRRKIRCDGGEPCQHCKQRKSECEYRGFVRQRKRKHELLAKNEDTAGVAASTDDERSPAFRDRALPVHHKDSMSRPGPSNRASAAAAGNINNGSSSSGGKDGLIDYSVAATHVASPSCIIQLYYGLTSNFSLMQLMYRQLVEGLGDGQANPLLSRRDEVEEVGAGLDLFSLRRLFFGDLAGNQDMSLSNMNGSSSLFFIHPSAASKYLERYLSTIYYLLPWQPKERYRKKVNALYQDGQGMSLESPEATIILLMLACGAAMVGDTERGEFLFRKAKANAAGFDELVNLQAIQVPLLMISLILLFPLLSRSKKLTVVNTPIINPRRLDPILHFYVLEPRSERPSRLGCTRIRAFKLNRQRKTPRRRGLLFGVFSSTNSEFKSPLFSSSF